MSQISDQINSLFLPAYCWMQLIFIHLLKRFILPFKTILEIRLSETRMYWFSRAAVRPSVKLDYMSFYILLLSIAFQHVKRSSELVSVHFISGVQLMALLSALFNVDSLRKCGPTDMLRQKRLQGLVGISSRDLAIAMSMVYSSFFFFLK